MIEGQIVVLLLGLIGLLYMVLVQRKRIRTLEVTQTILNNMIARLGKEHTEFCADATKKLNNLGQS